MKMNGETTGQSIYAIELQNGLPVPGSLFASCFILLKQDDGDVTAALTELRFAPVLCLN